MSGADQLEMFQALGRMVTSGVQEGDVMGPVGTITVMSEFVRYGWEKEAAEIQDLFLSGKRAEAIAAVPDEYIDLSALIGDEGHVRERIQVFKDVGVTYLNITPHGPDPLETIEKIKSWAE